MIHSLAALEALEPAWAELDRHAWPRTPFTGPRWNLLWWNHFAESRALVKDSIFSFAFFDESQLIAVAPMILTQRPAMGPLRTRQLQFFGADPNVTELRGPCMRREDEPRVFEALLSKLWELRSDWDWVNLGGFVDQGPAHQQVCSRGSVELTRQVPDFLIQPGPDWDAYKTALPKNLKESLRKCYASLKRDGLHHELKVAQQPADVALALERFFALHTARAAAPVTPPHADVFAPVESRHFVRELVTRSAEAQEAKVFELYVEGQPVAARLGFVLDESVYLYFSGYLPSMADYSVMTTCTVEAIRWAISQKLTTVNLSPGRDQSKLRWRPTEIPFLEMQWVSPSLRGPAMHRVTHSLDRRMREALAHPGALGQLARLVQRRRA